MGRELTGCRLQMIDRTRRCLVGQSLVCVCVNENSALLTINAPLEQYSVSRSIS